MKFCPHCNAELKDDASFCRHCGSDMNTGWAEGADFTDLETPDYEEILENEFGNSVKKKSPITIAVAIIVALAFALLMFF
ncbi:MAG: zinc-ribbon domain-containing protein [Fibrobacteraceae bacterium]|nr:zinc-ribbon domain-containing protein [Fibrobacteraceae bacterium]